MGEKNSGTQTASDRELVINRTFDAPRELVWKAWTENMDQWSAPRGFTIPVSEGDLRPGGKWHAVMVTPDGKELPLGGAYREIVPPERLVFTHAWNDATGKPGPETLVTVTLTARGNQTEMNFRQTGFDSVDSRNGHADGWGQSFDRLEEVLVAKV
ncbi:MAG: SRPBCC domain-containing protein [Gemmatimonadales bacterium]